MYIHNIKYFPTYLVVPNEKNLVLLIFQNYLSQSPKICRCDARRQIQERLNSNNKPKYLNNLLFRNFINRFVTQKFHSMKTNQETRIINYKILYAAVSNTTYYTYFAGCTHI